MTAKPKRLKPTVATRYRDALIGHYEAIRLEATAAHRADIEQRYEGWEAHWATLLKPALIAEARRQGFTVSARARKDSIVRRLTRKKVPDWREALEKRTAMTCKIPRLSKHDRGALEAMPQEFQELYDALTDFCDTTPEFAAQHCAAVDRSVENAGFVTLSAALRHVGVSEPAVKRIAKLCPDPVPF